MRTISKTTSQYYDLDFIKVITGVRRCGKSRLLEAIIDEMKENGIDDKHILYINFEDFDYDYIDDAKKLNDVIKSKIHDEKNIIYFWMKYNM